MEAGGEQQGRQDSNLQPPVLETGALPVELRPWVAAPGLYWRLLGHPERMTEHDETRDTEELDADELLAEQEGKGYGEDEGERDEAIEDE